MPEFLSAVVEWLRARSGTEQALIGAVVIIVLAAASQAASVVAALVFVVAAVASVVQLVRRRSARGWMFVALGSLAVAIVFFALASVIYGPAPQERQPGVERAKQPATQEEPELPMQQREDPAPERVPQYSIADVYIDERDGPGSAAALRVIAPDVERGEEVARLIAAEYAQHDYVEINLYASEEAFQERNSYATATVAFSERGAEWTGLEPGEMSYEPE